MILKFKFTAILITLLGQLLVGCSQLASLGQQLPTPSISVGMTSVPSPTLKPSASATVTPTQTLYPSPTLTSTALSSPTPSETPTPDVPFAKVLMQSNCRYGPGKAYLYSHGLYEGDTALVEGRSFSGTWLWIKPFNLERHCWAAASVMEVSGDPSTLPVVQTRLPFSTLYGPPQDVETARRGSTVVIGWEAVWMTVDDFRGYLIEALVCQSGNLLPIAVHTEKTRVELVDEPGCALASSGKLYSVEKHGYTDPVDIPWP